MTFKKVSANEVELTRRVNASAAKYAYTEDIKSLVPGELAFLPLSEYKGDDPAISPARGLSLTLHRAAKEVGVRVVCTPATHSGVKGLAVRIASITEATAAETRAVVASVRATKQRDENKAAKASATAAAKSAAPKSVKAA